MSKIKLLKLNKTKWIIICIIVLVTIIIFSDSSSNDTPVISATTKKGSIKSYIEQRAITDLPVIYTITMPYNSRIMPTTKKPGDIVKKGETVASLDIADINTKVQIAQANLDDIQGQIKLNEYRNFAKTALKESTKWIKTMEQLLGMTKIKITASQHVFDYALQHRNALVQSGRAVSRIEKNEAEMQAAVKEVDLQSSKMANSAMKFFTDIWKLAPIYIEEYINARNISREVLTAELMKAKAQLFLAEKHLKMSNMKSPVDGVILKRYVTNERFLPIGTVILDIGVMQNLEISANVLTTDVTNIKVGDSVDVYGAAIGNTPIMAKVSQIEPQGFTDISSLGVKQQKVKVKIKPDPGALDKLSKEGRTLGVGYRVFVKIYTSEAENALIIPRTTLFKGSNNQWEVFSIENNTAILKKVNIGILNDESAQVLSGLKANDRIIIAPPTSLKDGSKVKYNK